MVNYSCEDCGKLFSQKSHYDSHKRRKKSCVKSPSKINILEDRIRLLELKMDKHVNTDTSVQDTTSITINTDTSVQDTTSITINTDTSVQDTTSINIVNNSEHVYTEDILKEKEIIQDKILTKIKKNSKFVDDINQEMHNEGINIINRYDIVINILNKTYDQDRNTISKKLYTFINNIFDNITINKREIYQIVFMFFGNKHFKHKLDQFYTPITICNFINSMLLPNFNIIDPACGVGDLINNYSGHKTFCDKSKDVLEITTFINKNNTHNTIIQGDSLDILYKNSNCKGNTYKYCILNPPFGSKTIVTNTDILNKYYLGKDLSKQEIGILFIELGLHLLEDNGVMFIILPNGYLGNNNKNSIKLRKFIIEQYTLLGVIKLPDNAFSRSGTGVSTSILIIKNIKNSNNYPIFITDVQHIGYTLNKKNTPIKYKLDSDGYYLHDDNMSPIIHNDFVTTIKLFKQFIFDNQITELQSEDTNSSYYTVNKQDLTNNFIIDIKRYLPQYKNIITKSIRNNLKQIKYYCDIIQKGGKLDNNIYYYIDISSVKTPLYNYKTLNKNSLPGRAKYLVKKNDILISRLKGTISFTIISEDKNNIIVSNGFTVLRPKKKIYIPIIFANLFSKEFKIQHQSMVTGSIMETLTNQHVLDIFINENVDIAQYNNIISAINLINVDIKCL